MIEVSNTNNQLLVTWANNLNEYYAFEDMKSVTPYIGQTGEFIVINFINENRNSSLRLPYAEISNQPSWTTLIRAVEGISAWMDTSIGGGLATEATLQQVEINTSGASRTPTFLRPTGVSGTIPAGRYSMSFASVGTADTTVGGITLKPGETLNFDAGAINNTLGAVSYSTTTAGAELIIITLT